MLTFEVIIVFLGLIGMVTALLLDKMRPEMVGADWVKAGAGAVCVFDDCPFEQSVRDDTSLAVALCPELQSRAGYDFPFESLARFLRRLFREDGILAVAVAETGCE